ncbi:MAG: hypothetical protein ACXQS7_06245 [Candidatus Syntropharchaeia archaeon]
MRKIDRNDLITIGEMEGGWFIEDKFKDEMTARTEVLWEVKKEKAEELASLAGGEVVDLKIDSATEWAIVMNPIGGLNIYFILQLYAPEFENEIRVLLGKEVKETDTPVEDVYDLTRLCANALVRAAKRILR